MARDFQTVEFDPSAPPAVGSTVSDFVRPLVTSACWSDVALADLLREGPVSLVFHSMIGGFPPIYVWDALKERAWRRRFGVEPIGVTISTPYEIRRFLDERDLDARIFSDPSNGIANAFDIGHEVDGMAGISEPKPAVVTLADEMTVQHVWVAQTWPAFPPYEAIEEILETTVA